MATFTDDFNRANTSDLGANWVEVSGDWSIVSNQLSPGAAGGTIILRAASAMASSDHYAQATIAATTAASHGIWCRGNSSGGLSSGYLWRNDGSSWDLFSVIGGSFTVIGSYAAAAAPGDIAKVQAVGSTIKAFVNGIERVSVTDTGVTTGTSVGFRSESAAAIRFDDFTAADVTAGAALTLAAATETAQAMTGTKAGSLGLAVSTDTAQALVGGKTVTLGTALAGTAAQALAGAKTALLPTAEYNETAQPFTGATSRSLSLATAVETSRPLTGAKSATLGTALEASTARPLTAAGVDVDIDVTVGSPYSRWAVSEPSSQPWPVGAPY